MPFGYRFLLLRCVLLCIYVLHLGSYGAPLTFVFLVWRILHNIKLYLSLLLFHAIPSNAFNSSLLVSDSIVPLSCSFE